MLEEKYLFEGVSKEIYQKHLERLVAEKREILIKLDRPEKELSNLVKYIDYATEISTKLLSVWKKQTYDKQTILQKLVFPEGIYYNKEKHICRTQRVNTFFSLNHLLSGETRRNKKANSLYLNKKSALVTAKGLEPPTLRAEI